jgi:hypothetical protein
MSDSGPIAKIAFAPAETAPPSPLPALGGAIDWTAEANWPTTIGCVDGSDDINLAADDATYTPNTSEVDVDPPMCLAPQTTYLRKNGGGVVAFSVYDFKQESMQLDSTAVTDANATERGDTITFKAMCVEIAGMGIDYYPNVRVKVSGTAVGVETVGNVSIEAMVYGTAAIKSGVKFYKFNG